MSSKPLETIVNSPPYFITNLTTKFDVNVGDAWSYTLPETGDLEDQEVTVSVSLDKAQLFMTYKDGVLKIAAGATVESFINSYNLTLTLTDTGGAKST